MKNTKINQYIGQARVWKAQPKMLRSTTKNAAYFSGKTEKLEAHSTARNGRKTQ